MKNNTKKAIIALSGGMDSCVCTAIAKLEYDAGVLPITIKRPLPSKK